MLTTGLEQGLVIKPESNFAHIASWADLPLFLSPQHPNFKNRLQRYLDFAETRDQFPIINIYEGGNIPEKVLIEIGSARKAYLVDVNHWSMPLNEHGLDISVQDRLPSVTHHVLTSPSGVLASCRTIYNPEINEIDSLPFLATNELNGETLNDGAPSVNRILKERINQDPSYKVSLASNSWATIERLVPSSQAVSLANYDRDTSIILAQAFTGAIAVSAAAYLRSKGVRHVVIQADDRYRKHYQTTLGLSDDAVVCTKIHNLYDGTPDPCHTMVLDLTEAEEYTRQRNPRVFNFYMQELKTYQ